MYMFRYTYTSVTFWMEEEMTGSVFGPRLRCLQHCEWQSVGSNEARFALTAVFPCSHWGSVFLSGWCVILLAVCSGLASWSRQCWSCFLKCGRQHAQEHKGLQYDMLQLNKYGLRSYWKKKSVKEKRMGTHKAESEDSVLVWHKWKGDVGTACSVWTESRWY